MQGVSAAEGGRHARRRAYSVPNLAAAVYPTHAAKLSCTTLTACPAAHQVLHEEARIFLYSRMLNDSECDHIIKAGRGRAGSGVEHASLGDVGGPAGCVAHVHASTAAEG